MRYIKFFIITVLMLAGKRAFSQTPITPGGPARVSATPATPPAAYPSSAFSYVRTWVPRMPLTDEAAMIAVTRKVREITQTTQYVDGLGRPLQTVVKGISNSGRDVVAPRVYDASGRESFLYLPYVQQSDNTTDGNFKTNPFNAQGSFYQNIILNPGIGDEKIYYARSVYESSSLARPLKMFSPGNTWSTLPTEMQYEVNTISDSVRNWTINGIIPITGSIYSEGSLYKSVTIDESGNKTVEFRNSEGQLLLGKKQMAAAPATGHIGWLCTYYIYDDKSNLRFIIPPLAVENAMINSWNVNSAAAELCYQYKYDQRKQIIENNMPGAGRVFNVYDTRNRLVFVQDSMQRMKSPMEWTVNFYDNIDRVVMAAIYKENVSRDSLQERMNRAPATRTITTQIPATADLALYSHDGSTQYSATNSITVLNGFDSGNGAEILFDVNPNAAAQSVVTTITNPLPNINASSLTPLIYTYYDNYNYPGRLGFISLDISKPQAADTLYPEALSTAYATSTNGLITGTKIRVLGTDKWLTTTLYYDGKGRTIQEVSDNQLSGKDVATTLYSFSNAVLSTYFRHQNPRSIIPEITQLFTYTYDHAGRLLAVKEKLNDDVNLERVLVANSYDELGRLKQKRLGVNGGTVIDSLNYTYNIRGWLNAINPGFVKGTSARSNWFGEELSFDNGFTVNQYNGNIAGLKWKSGSDTVARAYGYNYDKVNRLVLADYTQRAGDWSRTKMDYSVSNLTYDANGNIKSLTQKGMPGNSIATIDQLTYTYQPNTNKLLQVADPSNTSTAALGDFINGTNTGNDYAYNSNGSLGYDRNKGIDTIIYNHLNLPETIKFRSKGVITYQYDAVGRKLKKTVIDSTANPVKILVTDYVSNMVYRQDSLETISHDNGRIRPIYKQGNPISFAFDYFEKDHLGNIRVILTEQTDFSMYAATMETESLSKEATLFSNVEETRVAKPAGYPEDKTTQKNNFVTKLNAKEGGSKIGPSLVLRVMAGDTVKINARAFYKSAKPENNKKPLAEDMVAAMAQSLNGSASSSSEHDISGNVLKPFNSNFYNNNYRKLKERDENRNEVNRPKAYLNFVSFDDQFKIVDGNSGVRQVKNRPDELQQLDVEKMVIDKTGFLYVYTSNETQQDVFFDNVILALNNGPLLEETHYYPHGLTMTAISSNALMGTNYAENRLKYNGQELQSKEFRNGTGLEWYDYGARMYDPQIGRWHAVDPLAEVAPDLTPFRYAFNNPVSFIDIGGLTEGWYEDENKNVGFDQNINSQADLEKAGKKGRYLGQEGTGIDEETGMINHYNADGTMSQGILTLNTVTIDLGLKNGFPAQMYAMADRDYYKGGYVALQDAIKSQQLAFDMIEYGLTPVVTTVATGGLQGLGVSGVTRGLVGEITWSQGFNTAMIKAADVNGKIAAIGMDNATAGSFFGWKNGFNTKTIADFSRASLEQNGITRESLKALMEAYHQVAQYSTNNPSAYVRFEQLKSLLTLFE